MKGLALVVVVLQLSYIHANLNGQTQVAEFSSVKQLDPLRIQELIPDANSLVEINLIKDYIADSQHHITKRQAEQQADVDAVPSQKRRRKRRRRRRKKVSSGSTRPSSPSMPEQMLGEPAGDAPMERPGNAPIENVLDPSPRRRERRRRPRPRPTAVDVPEPMPEAPLLSEMRKEDTNGLLRAEELQANYIKTEMIRAQRVKADRIKADKIKAQDVVVTSKAKRRRPRPSASEFIQLEPTYERIGTQRMNSVVDSHRLEPLQISQSDQPNYFDTLPYIRKPNPFDPQPSIQRRYNNRETFIPQQERFKNLNTRSRDLNMRQMQPIQAADVMPDIAFATRQRIPKLSEFIAEPPSFRSTGRQVKQDRIRTRNPPAFDQYDPFTDHMTFDNPDTHFKTDNVNTRSRDFTSKSYLSKADPWFFS